MFESVIRCFIVLFVVVINSSFYVILIRNDSDQLIHLLRKLQMRIITNMKINEYYYLNDFEKAYELIFKLFK